jgi:hypothetical protein
MYHVVIKQAVRDEIVTSTIQKIVFSLITGYPPLLLTTPA